MIEIFLCILFVLLCIVALIFCAFWGGYFYGRICEAYDEPIPKWLDKLGL